MSFLIVFITRRPSFTRTFSTRHGLPARLELRRFHPVDANRYFLFLRDSNIRALRNVFSGARFIGTSPIYTNEKVTWKVMNYPGPWVPETDGATADRVHATYFDMAEETDENVDVLRRRVVKHDALRESLEAARVVDRDGQLVLETDVVVVGSGAGGSLVCGGACGSGGLLRGRRAAREDEAADPHRREGRLHRARRIPPARAPDDAAHVRDGILGSRGLWPDDPDGVHRSGDRKAGRWVRDDEPRPGLRPSETGHQGLARSLRRRVRLR